MSKKMMRTHVVAQYAILNAETNKDRLKYIVAGIKNGKFYDYAGTDYGVFDKDAPDTEFMPESDLGLSRITGSKLATITIKMQKFFDSYFDEDKGEPEEYTKEEAEAEADTVEEVDTEAVEKAIKKAIKKGDLKKAQKLIDKLGGHKKLQKKLDKAGKE